MIYKSIWLSVVAILCWALPLTAPGQIFTNAGVALPRMVSAGSAWGDFDNDGDPDLLLIGENTPGYWLAAYILRNDGGSFANIAPSLPGGVVGSAAWGDYDRDGDLDALMASRESGVHLYRNDSNNVFTPVPGDFPTGESSISWVDFDNDGDLDFLAAGTPYTGTKIFRNDGGDRFTSVSTIFPGLYDAAGSWGDFDNDGDLDLALTGSTYSYEQDYERTTAIFRNDGNGIFTDVSSATVAALGGQSVAWGDYDNDGDLDLAVSGWGTNSGYACALFRNDAGNFVDSGVPLDPVSGPLAWGDSDNDGFLDLLSCGYSSSGTIPRLYRNLGNGTFTNSNVSLPAIGAGVWGDYDGDGDLDLLMAEMEQAQLLRNTTSNVNATPAAPSGLGVVQNGNRITLHWSPSTDENQAGGLSYNLQAGTSSGALDVVSPMADLQTGLRRVPERGTVNTTNAVLYLPVGTYYWRVQAVDHSFAGSPFSTEASFSVPAQRPWVITQGIATNGAGRLAMTGDVNPNTEATTFYFEFGPDASYGSRTTGQPIGSGKMMVTVSNLMENYQVDVPYHYRIVASNRFGVSFGEDRVFVPPQFIDVSFMFPAISAAWLPTAWGDYDNDGFLDAATTAAIIRNTGHGFLLLTNFYGLTSATEAPAWGDYDNDGDLDLLITGTKTFVARNDAGGFVLFQVSSNGTWYASGTWIDYDNDGDLDILTCGTGPSTLLRNDGRDSFTPVSNNFPYLVEASIAVAEYDRDGDWDVAVAGSSGTNLVAVLYRNDANGSFAPLDVGLPALGYRKLAWGDYDNDGDPDLAIAGGEQTYGTNHILGIFRNDPSGFTNVFVQRSPYNFDGLAWGDWNNDGLLELAVMGAISGTTSDLNLFQNAGSNVFIRTTMPNAGGDPAAGDFDNDGSLDILLGASSPYRLLRNNNPIPNTPPSAPSGLSASVSGDRIVLSWQASLDPNQTGGLSYNVRIGTTTRPDALFSGMADVASGWRRVPKAGNAGERLSWTLTNAQFGGTYTWSVQAIDNSFAGSGFAPPETIVLGAKKPQAVTGVASNLAPTTAELHGDAFAGGAATSCYFDYGLTTNYGLKSSSRSIGSESRWIHVSETVSNLAVGATYHYRMVATSAQGTAYGADAQFTTVQFSPFAHLGASNAIYGVSPGDFDNDGDLDFAVTFSGNYTGRIYRNDGNGVFSDIGLDLIRSDGYQPEWVDYDNDGDLDLSIGAWTYYPEEHYAPLIYRNEGGGVFTTATQPSFYTLGRGPLYWGDFDNDADPDLLFIIESEGARFYRNDNGQVVNLGLLFGASLNSSAAVGDYDKDGDLDVLLTGVFSSVYRTILWLNAGNGSFYASPESFTGIARGTAVCGDLDNDGDLDVLISGATNSYGEGATKLYRNNNGTFAEVATSMPGLTSAKASIGDYDNDGLPDIALQGYTATGSHAGLWRNQGVMVFSETGIVTGQGSGTPVKWADFDNDGALDFILASSQGGTLYRNNAPQKNTVPAAPGNLNSSVAGSSVMLAWSPSADPNQSGGLTYNVRMGSLPGQNDVLSPLANAASGYRTVPAMGNAQTRAGLRVNNLPGGNYYWSVQAVDHAFAGSRFAGEGSFIINGPPTISDITNQVTFVNMPTPAIPFTARGVETASVKLSLTAASSNPSLIPTNNIVFSGLGKNRTISLAPVANQSGTAIITVQVKDAYGATATDSFVLTVEAFTEMPMSFAPLWYGSAAWGDYDNDGDLDLLYNGQDSSYAPRTKLCRNNGNGSFTEVSAGLPAMFEAAISWGDYDNDGWLDILLHGGLSNSSAVLRVYRNLGNGTFASVYGTGGDWSGAGKWGDFDNDGDLDFVTTAYGSCSVYRNENKTNFSFGLNLPGASFGSAAWSDYDLDGDLDVITMGTSSSNFTRLYRNDGNGVFVDSGIPFPGVQSGDLAWGDYDNDGDPDLLLMGESGSTSFTRVFRNDRNGTFTDINAGLFDESEGSVAWGDYDNDGDLDILVSGGIGSWHATRVYRNDNGTFRDIEAPFANVADGAAIWGDYDGDGDLDAFVFGVADSGVTNVARLYRNNYNNSNPPPTAPGNVAARVNGASVTLSWAPATDPNQAAGLSYNVRIGSGPGLSDVVGPMADPGTGKRRLPAVGNAGERLSYTITNLQVGTYYARVQAIDNCFAGSAFSAEAAFTVTKPLIQPIGSQVAFPGVTLVVPLTASAPGTSEDTLVLSASSSDTNLIADNAISFGGSGANRTMSITAGQKACGALSITLRVTDANGGYAVATIPVRVEMFSLVDSAAAGTNHFALPGDYDNDGFLDLFVNYVRTDGVHVSGIYRNRGDGTFTNTGIEFPPMPTGNGAAWGDFDRDGYLDLALVGSAASSRVVRVFRNNGGVSFSDTGTLLPITSYYGPYVAWADCDGDGRPDLAVCNSAASVIYRNTGGLFTNTLATLPGVSGACLAFGDYDNDGAVDLALSGLLASGTRVCWVYRNDGYGNFLVTVTNIPGIYQAGIAWGDYDADGDLDLALAGDSTTPTCRVYRNDGGGVFAPAATNLVGTYEGTVAWGDYDNDGRLDLLVSGTSYSPSRIYRNLGGGTFTNVDAGLRTMSGYIDSWADLDNDGDLDIVQAGNTDSTIYTYRSFIYRNNIKVPNLLPSAPAGLVASLLPENDVLLAWGNGSDAETPASGLSYNVRAGTVPGAIDIIAPQSETASGRRRLADFGNAGSAHMLRLSDLPRGTYYWSVQAIDPGLSASLFAREVSFAITNGRPTLSRIADQIMLPGHSMGPVPFTAYDLETPPDQLVLTATSSNTNFVPDANIVFSGSGSNRFVTVTSAANTEEQTRITIVARDSGGLGVTNSFLVALQKFTPEMLSSSVAQGKPCWFDYDNDGDLDVVVIGQDFAGSRGTALFRNNGAGAFDNVSSGLPALTYAALDAGDYDNDGFIDLLISGYTNGAVTRIYRNLSNGTFTNINAALLGVYRGAVAWADYDNDGDLDVVVTGTVSGSASGAVSKLYRNDNGRFIEQPLNFPGVYDGAVAWLDSDNDGDLDLVLSGATTNSVPTTRLFRNDAGIFAAGLALSSESYRSIECADFESDGDLDLLLGSANITRVLRNDGSNVFTAMVPAFRGVGTGSAGWGDYDSDGDTDILVCGSGVATIYRNDAAQAFATETVLTNGLLGSASWADYDSDGDLDFAVVGSLGSTNFLALYRNNFDVPNTPPAPPAGLAAVLGTNNAVTLSWLPAFDPETTNANGLNYNLRVGTAPGASGRVASHSDPVSGFRRLVLNGNTGSTNFWKFSNLPKGTYYWSVQSIDPGFAGSSFAPEGSFSISNAIPTISPISNIVLTYNAPMVVPFEVNDEETEPTNLVIRIRCYDTNALLPGALSIEGVGRFRNLVLRNPGRDGSSMVELIVADEAGAFAATTFLVTVETFSSVASAFPQLQNSMMAWGDYDSDGDMDVLLAGLEGPNKVPRTYLCRNDGMLGFTNMDVGLPGVNLGAAAWGDYDGDGDLDFVLTGSTNYSGTGSIAWIYRNDGAAGFARQFILGYPIYRGSAAWGDCDNDGDLDLVIAGGAGQSGYGCLALYRNNAGTNFSTTLLATGNSIISSGVAWADFDNDGDFDIVAAGIGTSTSIWRNNGNGSFVPTASLLPGSSSAAVAVADVDSDGRVDVLFSGNFYVSTNATFVLRNNGNMAFSRAATLAGARAGSVAWGDYDGDGVIDFVVSGATNAIDGGARSITKVYRGDGAFGFTDVNVALPGIYYGASGWIDYDDDGDLDIFTIGSTNTDYYYPGGIAKIWRNNSVMSNTPPSAPFALSARRIAPLTHFAWSRPADLETTNSLGLTYQLRIGTSPGGSQIYPDCADATGRRNIPAFGLIATNTWPVRLLPGTYYWSVQAIDPGLASSPFAPEQQFTVTNSNPVAYPQIVVLGEDTSRTLTLSSYDVDGQTVTYLISEGPTHGVLTQLKGASDPSFNYRPQTNYFGADAFTYQVSDGETQSLPALVSLVITQIQDVVSTRLLVSEGTNRQMQLHLTGEPFERYRIEASQDFVIWLPVTNVLLTNLNLGFIDPDAWKYSQRFYRSVWDPPTAGLEAIAPVSPNVFRFMVTGEVGRTFQVEASTNLTNWSVISSLVITNRTTPFYDMKAGLFDRRFYRLR